MLAALLLRLAIAILLLGGNDSGQGLANKFDGLHEANKADFVNCSKHREVMSIRSITLFVPVDLRWLGNVC